MQFLPVNFVTVIFVFFFLFVVGRCLGRDLGVRGYFFISLSAALFTVEWTIWRFGYMIYQGMPSDSIEVVNLFPWLKFKSLQISWCFELTFFSLLMSSMILIVFTAVLSFSYYYLKTDPKIIQFFSYLHLFVGFMLLLVYSGNFVVFFMGWEGVGLSSFLLINFWTTRLQTSKSALKALLVNRIGDFFLLIAIAFIYKITHTFDFQIIFACISFVDPTFLIGSLSLRYIDVVSFCLLVASMSKSAQVGLHIWLPDAMEGPTPVSAMIHAATMVTAGLYLLLRCSSIIVLSPASMNMIFTVGAITVLTTSLIGAWQYDIKKIIAFSTCSQLGYMMTLIGASHFSLSFFHLLSHAFFKALLFLTAGAIIHAAQGEQDLRRLAGSLSLWSKKPLNFLYVSFLVGTLSIVGLTFFSGFYSKELLIFALIGPFSTSAGVFSAIILSVSVFLTSYYSFRVLNLLFFANKSSVTKYYQTHSTTLLDIWAATPLVVLMVFSIVVGLFLKNIFISSLLSNVLCAASANAVSLEFLPLVWKLVPATLIILGLLLARQQSWVATSQQKFRGVSRFIQSKYYYDNLLNKFSAQLLHCSKKIYLTVDKGVLEWIGPYGLYKFFRPISFSVDYVMFDRRIESSYLGFVMGLSALMILLVADTAAISNHIALMLSF